VPRPEIVARVVFKKTIFDFSRLIMVQPKITIYTDGAARGNPGPGGYGVILMSGPHRKELSQGYRLTTNNRMELLAVIVALESLKIENSDVTIFTDSKYVADAVEKRWVFEWVKKRFKGKKNPDLWLRFLKIYEKHKVKFVWIKGHNDNPYNERCDLLAVEASMSPGLLEDTGYKPELKN
jgi:ribonuclease HI